MKNTPITKELIDKTIDEFQIVDFSKATIREVKAIAARAEQEAGVEFIKMEMGVPGLPPSAVGVKAEVEALQKGIASLYPDINGLAELKQQASNFVKAFINVDLKPEGCVPVTVQCKEHSLHSSPAANVIRRKIRFFSSIPAFLYRNNNWLSWVRSMKLLMYMTIVAIN
jgi:hypothetical protein